MMPAARHQFVFAGPWFEAIAEVRRYTRGMPDPAGAGKRNGSRPTIYEVARRAGVSIATVSRVVTGSGTVGGASSLRVEQAIASTGWVPDPAARQLAGAGGDQVVLAIGVADRQGVAGGPHHARGGAGAGGGAGN